MSLFSRIRPIHVVIGGTAGVGALYVGHIFKTKHQLGNSVQTTSDFTTGAGLGDKYYRYGSYFRTLPISPETSHHAIISLLSQSHSTRVALGLTDMHPDPESLHTQICGLYLSNPIGLAAGMDKDGEAIDGILDMGFGFMELGSVTPHPQPGNPLPRLFRLASDRCIINRYGFNSDGINTVKHRLLLRHAIHARSYVHVGKTPEAQQIIDNQKGKLQYVHVEPIASEMEQTVKALQSSSFSTTFHTPLPLPTSTYSHPIISTSRGGLVGLNLGKNKTTEDAASDYVHSIATAGYLADYIVVNVSSPNTPGLRDLQGKQALYDLLSRVKVARDTLHIQHPSKQAQQHNQSFPPLFVKIAPDLTDDDKRDIADVVMSVGMDGMIISNTTIARPDTLNSPEKKEVGGLSGPILMEPSTKLVSDMFRLTQGRVPIIGVGGVSSGADAYRKIRAGASAVQLYTAFIYDGPALVSHIKHDLATLLARDGYQHVSQAVGADVKDVIPSSQQQSVNNS